MERRGRRERREKGEEGEKWSGERSEGRGEGRRREEVRWRCEVCIGIHGVYTSVVREECQQGVWNARYTCMRYCPTPHCPSLPVWGRVPRPYRSPRSQAACVSSCEPAVDPSSVWCCAVTVGGWGMGRGGRG